MSPRRASPARFFALNRGIYNPRVYRYPDAMERFIQPFIEVCVSVFKDLVKCDLVPDRAYFTEKDAFLKWDISGLIALTGEARGVVAVSMNEKTAIGITKLLTGIEHTYLDSDVVDTIGEIVNIIAGNVKKNLEETFRLIISLPYIIKGKAHLVVIPMERSRLLCIPFTIFTDQVICLSVAID
jgi:chemotaxis protein CheX